MIRHLRERERMTLRLASYDPSIYPDIETYGKYVIPVIAWGKELAELERY